MIHLAVAELVVAQTLRKDVLSPPTEERLLLQELVIDIETPD